MKLPYLPWPVPACAGLLTGIVVVGAGPVAAIPFLVVASLLIISQPQPRQALLVVLVAVPLGAGRQLQWQARADPIAGLAQAGPVLMGGHSDGTVLDLEWPVRASLWISPAGALPAGEVVLTGAVDYAPGRRNPGGFDFRSHLSARGIHGQVVVSELRGSQPVRGLKERLRAGLRNGLSGDAAALTEALTLGERSELGGLRDSFAAAGLAHLLALSGLHLGVLVGTADRLLRRTGRLRFLLLPGLVAGFLVTVGVSASLLRAALMSFLLTAGDWAGSGRPSGWTRLCLAALITLLWRPAWLFDLSFQLSYLCLAGLLGFASGRSRGAWWQPQVLLLGGAVASIAAQLPTMSLTAGTFNAVPLFSVPVNLLAIPLAGLLVPLGMSAALLGALHPALALVPNVVTDQVAGLLIRTAEAGALLPQLTWGEVSASGHLHWACFCLVLLALRHGWLRPLRAALLAAVVLGASLLSPDPKPPAELIALDVGQGDAFLLRFRRGPAVLVDAGGNAWSDFDPGARTVVPALRALGVTSLDLVVATHADADHIGGLPAVLDALPVQALLLGADESGRPLFDALLAAAARNSVPVLRAVSGESLLLGDLRLQVLNPLPVPTGEPNEDSLAFNIWWQDRPVAVMPGEVSERTEARLAAVPAPVLIVPHHGSRFSSSERLLAAVAGQVAVISVGRNNYGHPHPSVLERLADHGFRVRTTMEEGAVRVALPDSRGGWDR